MTGPNYVNMMWQSRLVTPIRTRVGEAEGCGRLKGINHVLAPHAIFYLETELNTILRVLFLPVCSRKGAFVEHAALLASLGADVREVRLPEEFEGLDGIVLPGEHASMPIPTDLTLLVSNCDSNFEGLILVRSLGLGCPWSVMIVWEACRLGRGVVFHVVQHETEC